MSWLTSDVMPVGRLSWGACERCGLCRRFIARISADGVCDLRVPRCQTHKEVRLRGTRFFLSLLSLCRGPHHQRHKPRHQRRDRPRQELPEPRGHHREVQGGHLLLRQGGSAPPEQRPSGSRRQSREPAVSLRAQARLPVHLQSQAPPGTRALSHLLWETERWETERWAACRSLSSVVAAVDCGPEVPGVQAAVTRVGPHSPASRAGPAVGPLRPSLNTAEGAQSTVPLRAEVSPPGERLSCGAQGLRKEWIWSPAAPGPPHTWRGQHPPARTPGFSLTGASGGYDRADGAHTPATLAASFCSWRAGPRLFSPFFFGPQACDTARKRKSMPCLSPAVFCLFASFSSFLLSCSPPPPEAGPFRAPRHR